MYYISFKSMNYKMTSACLKQGGANFGTQCSFSIVSRRFVQCRLLF